MSLDFFNKIYIKYIGTKLFKNIKLLLCIKVLQICIMNLHGSMRKCTKNVESSKKLK